VLRPGKVVRRGQSRAAMTPPLEGDPISGFHPDIRMLRGRCLEWMWSRPGFPASTVPGRENQGWESAVSATGRRASLGPTMISDRSPVQLQLQQASGTPTLAIGQ